MWEHKELHQYLRWAPALGQSQRIVPSAEANKVESMLTKKQKDSHVSIYRGICPLSCPHTREKHEVISWLLLEKPSFMTQIRIGGSRK